MAAPLPSRSDVLRCFGDANRAYHTRELATLCKVRESRVPRFVELLEQLVQDGTLQRLSGARFKVRPGAGTDSGGFEGALSMNPRGFGFVTAVGHDDVYVAPDAIGAALHGDRVSVQIMGRNQRGVEGRIAAVVQRRSPRLAGVLHKRRKGVWLEPDDARVRGPIVITGGDVEHAEDGAAAIVNITRFPAFANENPEGELVAVLGLPGDPNTEVAKILMREQINEQHSDAAVAEAEAMAAKIRPLQLEGRVDLRNIPLPTLDPEDARDHDDAIWVERTDDGYRAWIAIADVSEYVQPESALDHEALARGCTIYLPDRALPMLPTALAADLCSLLPDRDRLCLCLIADLSRQGDVVDFEIVEGVMRSAAMLTYGGAARALGFSEAPPRSAQAEAFKVGLRRIDELARKLRRQRMRRGALDLNLPEPRVELDPKTGVPTAIRRRAQDPGIKRAYSMVEELMLLANELTAVWLTKRKIPTIYRVHAQPDPTKLERLAGVAEALGVEFDLDEMNDAEAVSRWLASIEGHPSRSVLEMLLLRSLKQATYDVVNIGHFGLASENYLHFTSPIRRYPDVLVHRAIKHVLRAGKPDRSPAAVEKLKASATSASVRERAAMDVEREVVDLYRALYMRAHIGETFEGSVSALGGGGLYVTLDDPFVDVLVRFEALGPDHYEPADDDLGVVGTRSGDTIRVGERMRVNIEDVAILRRAVLARRIPPPGLHAEDTADNAKRPQRRGKDDHKDATRRSTPKRAASGGSNAGGAGARHAGNARRAAPRHGGKAPKRGKRR